MSLEQLLERWARVEPERCYLASAGKRYGKPIERFCIPLGGVNTYFWHGVQSVAIVQAAVMEAITGHDWIFSLEGTNEYAEAFIWTDTEGYAADERPQHRGDGVPVVALLTAYLAALAHEKETA